VDVASFNPLQRLLCMYRRNERSICQRRVAAHNENGRSMPKSRHNRSFRRVLDAANSRCARKLFRSPNGFRPMQNPSPRQRWESRQTLPEMGAKSAFSAGSASLSRLKSALSRRFVPRERYISPSLDMH
jgi:hypothetical protein